MEGKKEKGLAPNPALPYREDCWSEGATSMLIDAWGERFVEVNRGNLRRKHWQEVADVINSRRTDVPRPARSDIQCKNRIDTLKKKYKMERIRIRSGDGKAASLWPFYDRLDFLIGASSPLSQKGSPISPPLPHRKKPSARTAAAKAWPSSTIKEKRHNLAVPPEDSSFLKRKYSAVAAAAAAAAAAHKAEEMNSNKLKSSPERSSERGFQASDNNGAADDIIGDVGGVRELARAVLHFGEIYERVEAAKQQQMLELEKQRMESTRSLETKMMQIFVDYQIQFEKLKRHKRAAFGEFEASSSSFELFQERILPLFCTDAYT
ncbi:unnamed protein product [Spirodela intermedia]|uniref:Myb/SANT-like DNA-binding domain-containing protein n=1 Tax=Spirodela intermedia TaxID=51605 RepID=A0A7I8KZD2_SPIIN|nr:unnamed protein product [Spirodela intermedia]